MSYSIEIMPQALNEIETAYRWIANNLGTEYVERWNDELNEALESLSNFPNRCPVVPRPKPTTILIRQLKVKTIAFYFQWEQLWSAFYRCVMYGSACFQNNLGKY